MAVLQRWRRPKSHGIQLWGVNLSELVPFAKSAFRGRDADKRLTMLRSANRILADHPQSNHALNAFLLEPDGVHLIEPHVVDFSRVTSISIKDVGRVLPDKILEMENSVRREFQLKLAYFYGRAAR